MEQPLMLEPLEITRDIESLVSYMPVPGFGVLPVNSFLIRAAEPVLVDTGLAALGDDYLETLSSLIDPSDLRWIWLTHTDADHVGNLRRILDEAPRARLVTTYLGMGKLGMLGLPVDRVCLVNPGQSLDVGDRQLLAVRPPSYDAPETTGLLDTHTSTLFSSDCFGALMESPQPSAAAMSREALGEGMKGWAVVDSPWLHMVDETRFSSALDAIESLAPATVLSSHLPPAAGMTRELLEELAAARNAPEFVGPDQAALELMMAAPATIVA